MPLFKSTYNILKKQDEDEVFDPNWMDSNKLVLPPSISWDYKREMTIDDVDIWEVLAESSMAKGVYAAWQPYAEFYLITTGVAPNSDPRWIKNIPYWDRNIETFYGPNSQKQVYARAKEIGINLDVKKIWVEPEEMWLYQDPTASGKTFSFAQN